MPRVREQPAVQMEMPETIDVVAIMKKLRDEYDHAEKEWNEVKGIAAEKRKAFDEKYFRLTQMQNLLAELKEAGGPEAAS